MIVVGHSQDFLHSVFPDGLIDIIGYGGIGVTMFAFLSGVGLWYSFEKNKDIARFYKKRITRVVIPYLLISIVFNLYLDIFIQKDIGLFLSDVSLISFWTTGRGAWYVAWTLLIYTVYPLFARIAHQRKWVSGILICLIVILIALVGIPARFQSAAGATIAFLFGDVMAIYVRDNNRNLNAGLACLTLFAPVYMLDIIRGQAIYVLFFAAVGVSLCAIFSYIINFIPMWCKAALLKVGKVSLECYLLNIYLISVSRHLLGDKINGIYGIIAYLVICVIGVCCSLLIGKIEQHLIRD